MAQGLGLTIQLQARTVILQLIPPQQATMINILEEMPPLQVELEELLMN
jgi:hypothetical protein